MVMLWLFQIRLFSCNLLLKQFRKLFFRPRVSSSLLVSNTCLNVFLVLDLCITRTFFRWGRKNRTRWTLWRIFRSIWASRLNMSTWYQALSAASRRRMSCQQVTRSCVCNALLILCALWWSLNQDESISNPRRPSARPSQICLKTLWLKDWTYTIIAVKF